MKKKKQLSKLAIIAVGIALICTGCLSPARLLRGFTTSQNNSTTEIANDDTKTENTHSDQDIQDKMDAINALIDSDFYFDATAQDREEAIYKGMMEGLDDPYSVYYTAKEYASLQEETSGEYVGIGVQVNQNMQTYLITVTKVFKDSPAAEAGMLPGDVIVQVDDHKLSTEEVSEVVEWIKGESGTTVDVTVYRESEKKNITLTVERRKVDNATVEYRMLDNNIGYIQVTEFYEHTAEQYIAAMKDLEAQGMQGLIVDLRDDPGGLISAVVEMCDYMIKDGKIVYTEDKNGTVLNEFNATSTHSFDKPMVVLVNGNSASASEIFSGAMKDHNVATLVGTQTFGKGIVQRIYSLDDGSAIKMTIAKYFTPNGTDIHGEGITPDIIVELPEEVATKIIRTDEEDTQLQKGIEVIQQQLAK